MAGEIAAAVEDVDEWSKVHGRVLMTDDEMVEGMRESGNEGHEGKIDDKREINKHDRVSKEDVFAFFSPFFTKEEKVEDYEGGEVEEYFHYVIITSMGEFGGIMGLCLEVECSDGLGVYFVASFDSG